MCRWVGKRSFTHPARPNPTDRANSITNNPIDSFPTKSTRPPTYSPTHHLHQAYEEACASATESTPAVEEALRFYASSGDEARLTALLERGIVNVMAKDKVGGCVCVCGLVSVSKVR